MYDQNKKIEVTYGNGKLKEILSDILKEEFIRLLNDEEGKA